jgi:hypothetical protein
MQTVRDIAPYAALAAAALCLILLVFVLTLWISVRRLRRAQTLVLGHHEQRDIVGHVADLDSQVRNLRDAVEILTDQLDEHKAQLDRALTNRAIVRYDAFRDAGGEQSASFALVDSYRSGVVMSAIAARDFARIYIKHLTNGVADRDLSPEEERAVAAAMPKPIKAGETSLGARRAAPFPAKPPRAPAGAPAQPAAAGAEPAPHDTAELAAAPSPDAERPEPVPAPEADPPAEAPHSLAPKTPRQDPAPHDTAEFTWDPGNREP